MLGLVELVEQSRLERAGYALRTAAGALGLVELSYSDVRGEYHAQVYGAVLEYLVSGTSSTVYKNDIKRAVADSFPQVFREAYFEGGADKLEPDDQEWLSARISAELGYIDELFAALKAIKDDELPPRELVAQADARAAGYSASLDAVYTQGLLRGQKNKMLTMVGDDGKESCHDCRRLKGKRYSAKKWLTIGIPGVPGNGYACGGYHCDHHLVDDDGNRWNP
jgi:hypothetical protein